MIVFIQRGEIALPIMKTILYYCHFVCNLNKREAENTDCLLLFLLLFLFHFFFFLLFAGNGIF
jgi:hypothetical protein